MPDVSRVLGRLVSRAVLRPAWQKYGAALLLPLLALAGTAYSTQLSRAPFFSLFALSVVVASIFGGSRPGLVSVAACVLINVLLAPPYLSVRVANPDDLGRILVFGAAACTMALFVGAAGELQRKIDLERQRLSVTLTSIGDAVIATDASGRITFLNPVAEELTGWSSQHAFAAPLEKVFIILNETTRKPVPNPVVRVMAEGRVVGLANHTILVRRDGTEVPIDDSAAPIFDGDRLVGVVLVFRDVTQARLAQTALLRSEKLATVGRLAATIAHEINNPLEAISNLLYLVQSAPSLETARQYAASAEGELARAAHVAQQTLSFARRRESPAAVSMAELVEGTLALFAGRLTAKNIEVVKRYDGSDQALVVAAEARQVIANLLGNALDAENPGGRIDVRVRPSATCKTVRLTIADRGCGIKGEHKSRLFEPFFTTKERIGTGLGLWVAKEIADAHGATIRVRSRAGRGSVFCVSWPAAGTLTADAATVS